MGPYQTGADEALASKAWYPDDSTVRIAGRGTLDGAAAEINLLANQRETALPFWNPGLAVPEPRRFQLFESGFLSPARCCKTGSPARKIRTGKPMQKILWMAVFATSLALPHKAQAQTEIYKPYKNLTLWHADTLYVGAGFARMDIKPVKISLVGNEAAMDGQLFYIDPVTGNEVFLFNNHDAPGSTIDLTSIVDVPIGKVITFVYKVVGKGGWSKDLGNFDKIQEPKYTGPNFPGSKYYSQASSNVNDVPDRRYGHRWSVAGALSKDVLEFGFEDDTTPTSDMDFDDIVFNVQGLTLVTFEKTAKTRSYVW